MPKYLDHVLKWYKNIKNIRDKSSPTMPEGLAFFCNAFTINFDMNYLEHDPID